MDRERQALGVPISEVFDTMQAYFGNLYIDVFVKFRTSTVVQTEALPNCYDISKIYVRAQDGTTSTMIPLSSVVTTEFNSGSDPVTHFNGFNSALGGAAPVIVQGKRFKMRWSR